MINADHGHHYRLKENRQYGGSYHNLHVADDIEL